MRQMTGASALSLYPVQTTVVLVPDRRKIVLLGILVVIIVLCWLVVVYLTIDNSATAGSHQCFSLDNTHLDAWLYVRFLFHNILSFHLFSDYHFLSINDIQSCLLHVGHTLAIHVIDALVLFAAGRSTIDACSLTIEDKVLGILNIS